MMKILLIVTLALAGAVVVGAQTKQEAQVSAAVEELRKAMVDGDRAKLERLAGDALSYGHSGGAVDDKKVFVDKLTNGSSDFVSIDLTEQTVKISGNVGIVRHTLSAQTNDGGKPGAVKIKVLLVWQNLKGRWQLVARQAVKLP